MSRAIRRRGLGEEAGPPELEKMLRYCREDYQRNVSPELKRRRRFVGPSAQRRRKRERALLRTHR